MYQLHLTHPRHIQYSTQTLQASSWQAAEYLPVLDDRDVNHTRILSALSPFPALCTSNHNMY